MGISVQKIGLRIRSLREQRGISLRQFALMTGLNKSHLSAIERGQLDMRMKSFGKILDGLGLSAEEFFKGMD